MLSYSYSYLTTYIVNTVDIEISIGQTIAWSIDYWYPQQQTTLNIIISIGRMRPS